MVFFSFFFCGVLDPSGPYKPSSPSSIGFSKLNLVFGLGFLQDNFQLVLAGVACLIALSCSWFNLNREINKIRKRGTICNELADVSGMFHSSVWLLYLQLSFWNSFQEGWAKPASSPLWEINHSLATHSHCVLTPRLTSRLTSLSPHTVINLIPSIKILILWVGIRTNDQVGLLLLSGSVGFVKVLGSIFFYISCSIFWSFSSSPNSYLPSGFFPLVYLPNFMFFVFFFSPKQQQQKQQQQKTQNTHTQERER